MTLPIRAYVKKPSELFAFWMFINSALLIARDPCIYYRAYKAVIKAPRSESGSTLLTIQRSQA